MRPAKVYEILAFQPNTAGAWMQRFPSEYLWPRQISIKKQAGTAKRLLKRMV